LKGCKSLTSIRCSQRLKEILIKKKNVYLHYKNVKYIITR
jgi:hypothetical protein